MSLHIVDALGVPVCPKWALRDAMTDGEFWDQAMTDGEFWDHVFGVGPEVEYEPDADELQAIADLTPCSECGVMGPCAYDVDGRALVHLVEDDSA